MIQRRRRSRGGSNMPTFTRQIRLTVGVLLLAGGVAQAKVTQITISKTSPAFKGQTFGKVGSYELIKGTAIGEIDPADRRNALITDIQFAPRSANGNVR